MSPWSLLGTVTATPHSRRPQRFDDYAVELVVALEIATAGGGTVEEDLSRPLPKETGVAWRAAWQRLSGLVRREKVVLVYAHSAFSGYRGSQGPFPVLVVLQDHVPMLGDGLAQPQNVAAAAVALLGL